MITFLTVTRIVGVAFLTFMALPKAATMLIDGGNILMLTLTMIVGAFMVAMPFFERTLAAERGYEYGRRRGIRVGEAAMAKAIIQSIPEGSIARAVIEADKEGTDELKRLADPVTLYWSVPSSFALTHRQLIPEGAGWILSVMGIVNGDPARDPTETAPEAEYDHV